LTALLPTGPAAVASDSHHAMAADIPRYLGGLHLDDYCRAHDGTGAKLTGSTAYDWHCAMPDDSLSDIYFDIACRWQYPDKLVTDRIANFYNAYSVQCWQINANKGQPDFLGYCKSKGQDDVVQEGNTVDDWRCVKLRQPKQPASIDIDVHEACHWTVAAPTINRFENFYDPWSWQCWV
jgi:hypothetical protein